MKKISGIGASKGIAIGKLTLCVNIDDHIAKKDITDVASELTRLDIAKEAAVEALNEIYLKAMKRVGEKNSMIFQIHIMMLQDDDFYSAMQNAIKISDLDTTPTDLISYRFYSVGPADINYGEIASNPTSNIFLTIRGDSIKKTIQNDSIESYHILCNSVYFRFSSRDTINLYLTSYPKPGHQYKFPADILFWKKEKSLYLFIMFPLDSDKPIGDDEIFKMLNFY